jgi:formylglycine-generating enzyme required for sulfatase activity
MLTIFISHVDADNELAQALAGELESFGYGTWYYERDSLPGVKYVVSTYNAIIHCEVFLILISYQSLASNQVQIELERAHEASKNIIPILYGVTDAEYKRKSVSWKQMIGASTSCQVTPETVRVVAEKIARGLAQASPEGESPPPPPFSPRPQASAGLPTQGFLATRQAKFEIAMEEGDRLLDSRDWGAAEAAYRRGMAVPGFGDAVFAIDGIKAAQAMLSEERRIAEEKRLADEKRLAEEKRAADEKRAIEAKRLAEEKRIAEEKRLAEEKRVADEKRAAEARHQAEEKRAADETRAAEAKRLTEARRIAEEQRQAEEKRLADEKRLAEAKRAADEKHAADEKRRAAEAKRQAEEKRLMEEKRVADEKRAAEARRVAEEKRLAEEKRVADEKRAAEARRQRQHLATLRVPEGCRAVDGTEAEPYSKSGWAQEIVHEATGMAFRFIPPGAFTMGSPAEEHRFGDMVQHRVTLTQGFYIGKCQVTQAQWERVTGANPSRFKGADLPVEKVSWDDCRAFLQKLGTGARLPTEAEWEYACRAGTTTALNSGKALTSADGRCPNLDEVAWHGANSDLKTHSVGQKRPNAWGLYDMHGNVWEWCWDYSDYGAYSEETAIDPQGAKSGSSRVVRGGSWRDDKFSSSSRRDGRQDYDYDFIGFRAVLPLAHAAEAKRLAEENRLVDEKRASEVKRVAEAKRLADEKRAAEVKRVAEAKRLADEKRAAEVKRVAEAKRLADEKRLAEEQRQRQYLAAVAAGEAAFKRQDFEAAAREARNALGLVPAGAEALALTERLLPTLEVRSLVDGRNIPGAVIGFSGKASEHRTPVTFKFEPGKRYEVSVSLSAADGRGYAPALKTFVADWRGPQVWAANLAEAKPEPPKLRVPEGCRVAAGAAAEPFSKSGWAQEIVHEATGMAFRFIPPGAFTMGSPAAEAERGDDEVQHRVTLTQGFYIGKCQVTQAQWERVTGANPSHFKGADLPVETVSWDDCQAFLQKLGSGARLPTEAEWEYACRAGTEAALNSGKAVTSADGRCPNLDEVAWYNANSGSKSHPVGQKRPNAWGLYDMHGNVWEWCADWHGCYHPTWSVTDPQGAQSGALRVLRGGGWDDIAPYCRSSRRYYDLPDNAYDLAGFRAVLPLGQMWAANLTACKPEPPKLRVPEGCRAVEGTAAEPFSKSGWAQEIVHAATGMAFRFIPPGAFTMGSPAEELGRSDVEVQHRVTLTRGFYLGKYQVTQAQWEKAMGTNPSGFKGADLPVETVSWNDCQAFLKKLGSGARLPTEAEWEYACRAGTTSALNSGKVLTTEYGLCPNLDEVAWYCENSESTHPVGQKRPNAWGLHDMHGNVWNWCSDWYGAYPAGAASDPYGAQNGSARVLRGGSWSLIAPRCRSAGRTNGTPDYANDYIGFRAALPLGQQ